MLLILFAVGAVAGVLVFAKTQVAPPMNIDLVDQYQDNLRSDCSSYTSMNDFKKSRHEYLRLDDKLKRFQTESTITDDVSDQYRQQIDGVYGRDLSTYGFSLFNSPAWNDGDIKELSMMLEQLNADKLSTGERAATEEFVERANKLNEIKDNYFAARQLARSTSFTSIADASSKINKANTFAADEYLHNNVDLVYDLRALRGKIAQSHRAYLTRVVNAVGGYRYVSKDEFKVLDHRADAAIVEFEEKAKSVYGSDTPSISDLKSRYIAYHREADAYYKEVEARSNYSKSPVRRGGVY